MALDPRYVILGSDLEQLFRDKDTGLPLSGGKVYFFEDDARTIPKPVYQLMGSPPNYTYVALPNPVTLNSVGAFGVNVYALPYDMTTGNLELYFIQVYNSADVFQFSREAIPNISVSEVPETQEINFITNGQFLAHNNILANGTVPAGRITQNETAVAYGGWYYVTNVSIGATDNVFFQRFDSFGTNPTQDPRYAINVECTNAISVSPKDLRLRFENVNRFSSDTEIFTFGFSGINNSVGNIDLEIWVIKNYGTGGTPHGEESFSKGTVTINSSYSNVSLPFVFGSNAGKSLGTNDDDYVDVAIRFPENSLFNISLTDVYLVLGEKNDVSYPITTNRQDKYRAVAGGLNLPDYDGNDVGLPLILTKTGIDYDRSSIGSLRVVTYETGGVLPGYLRAVGTQYETNAIDSTDGIPYSRLQQKYFNNTLRFPIHGTGQDYQIMLYDGSSSTAILSANRAGTLGGVAAGTSPFTVTRRIHIGVNGGYRVFSTNVTSTTFRINNLEDNAVTEATAGTSTFVMSLIQSGLTFGATSLSAEYRVTQHGAKEEITDFNAIAASTLGGLYFTFTSLSGGTPTSYYLWYTVAGAGADPAVPGHTGIQVNLETADTAAIVANKTIIALNGREASLITFTDGSTITGGDYFLCDTFTANYYVWYKVDGIGGDPMVASRTGIQVDVLSTDTIAQVVSKTTIAINSKFFAVPDYRGLFPRMLDLGANNDQEPAERYSSIPGYFGDMLGTFERDTYIAHRHPPLNSPDNFLHFQGSGSSGAAGNGIYEVGATGDDGFFETRPKNFNVDIYIKY